jgi:hypothetical protein
MNDVKIDVDFDQNDAKTAVEADLNRHTERAEHEQQPKIFTINIEKSDLDSSAKQNPAEAASEAAGKKKPSSSKSSKNKSAEDEFMFYSTFLINSTSFTLIKEYRIHFAL